MTNFAPANITRDELFTAYGAPKWVQDRIIFMPESDGGLRLDARGGKISIADDGTERTTTIKHAGQRMLLMVVPADSVHGRFRAPGTDADFVAVFTDANDDIVGKPVHSTTDVAAILASVM